MSWKRFFHKPAQSAVRRLPHPQAGVTAEMYDPRLDPSGKQEPAWSKAYGASLRDVAPGTLCELCKEREAAIGAVCAPCMFAGTLFNRPGPGVQP